MKSNTIPSFWECYYSLPTSVKKAARKAFLLWRDFPFHPSLHFKCIDRSEGIWSCRITLSYRALCVVEKDSATWFWIGNHEDYERFFG